MAQDTERTAEELELLAEARLRYRRLGAYYRRTARAPAPKTRTSDVAARRIGDGLKPNHRARAVAIGDVFPKIEHEVAS